MLAVDGQAVEALGKDKVREALQGPEGRAVQLTVTRLGTAGELKVGLAPAQPPRPIHKAVGGGQPGFFFFATLEPSVGEGFWPSPVMILCRNKRLYFFPWGFGFWEMCRMQNL